MKTINPKPRAIQNLAQWESYLNRLQYLRSRIQNNNEDQIAEMSATLVPQSMDLADSATDEFDHDMAFSLLAHEQNALYEVNAAIRRIQDGTYGICEETGKAIPDERLQAVPWTRYTREVEERLENERGVQLAHLNLYPASRIPNLMAYQKRKTHHRKTH